MIDVGDFAKKVAVIAVATAFVILVGTISMGFVFARLYGLPVDVEKFYGLAGPFLGMMLQGLMTIIAGGRSRK